MDEKYFRVMPPEANYLHCPNSIPWGLIEPHREQAKANHGQSLERLNERGGLSPVELYYVLQDKNWSPKQYFTDEPGAVTFLLMRLNDYRVGQLRDQERELERVRSYCKKWGETYFDRDEAAIEAQEVAYRRAKKLEDAAGARKALLDAFGEPMVAAYNDCSLHELAATIISQRDNARNESDAFRKRIEATDSILCQLEDTAKGFQGDLVTEARIALMDGKK